MKVCPNCLSKFKPNQKRGGVIKFCKPECSKASRLKSNRASKQRNADKYRSVKQAWNERNKEKIALQGKLRWQKNRLRLRILNKLWRKKNRERLNEKTRAWLKAHPDRVKEYKLKARLNYKPKKYYHNQLLAVYAL